MLQFIIENMAYSLGWGILVILFAVLGYCAYNIRGAAAAAGIGQYLTDAGMLSSQYIEGGNITRYEAMVCFLIPLLCVSPFMFVTYIINIINYQYKARGNANSLFQISALLLASSFNYLLLMVTAGSEEAQHGFIGMLCWALATGGAAAVLLIWSGANVARTSRPSTPSALDVDPYTSAGREVLEGKVDPGLWARALAASNGERDATNSAYVKLRVAELELQATARVRAERATVLGQGEQDRRVTESHEERAAIAAHAATVATSAPAIPYRFSEASLSVYDQHQLTVLERILRNNRREEMAATKDAICRKIGWNGGKGDNRAFLEAYYTQLRARLERTN